jgi:hypothetical protein
LAKSLAAKIQRPPIPADSTERARWIASSRARLKNVIRYQPVTVKHPWVVGVVKNKGADAISYRFQLSNNLSATGIWLKQIPTPPTAPVTILLDDQGKQATINESAHGESVVADLLERGHQVLVLDLLFTPISSTARPQHAWSYALLLSALGDRPLGIEAAQLLGIADWAKTSSGTDRLDVVSYGIRDQVIALAASALQPDSFASVDIHGGMHDLNYILEAPVPAMEAPDLFCQDFYKEFELNQLIAMAGPERIHQDLFITPKK